MHPNVNKPKSLAARAVSGPVFLSFYEIIVRFFSFFCQNANETGSNKQDRQDQINTKQDNRFQLVKKKKTTTTTTTQVSTASNTKWTAKKRTSYVFLIFY